MLILLILLLLQSAATFGAACPVPLIELACDKNNADAGTSSNCSSENGQIRLSKVGLQYLQEQDSPIFLVPALGMYRSGKSFLLNHLMEKPVFSVGHQQSTHTRGIEICAEAVPDLGTVVWMDTEGLWSGEDAQSGVGSKIFSLSLLFASTVLLSNDKVLNELVFQYFAEQQKYTRVLQQELKMQGLLTQVSSSALLPTDLSLLWVVQRPIQYTSSSLQYDPNDDGDVAEDNNSISIAASEKMVSPRQQLEAFLRKPGDNLRARVQQDFVHYVYEVPNASNDVGAWKQLDKMSRDDLLPEYLESVRTLRQAVLSRLKPRPAMDTSSIVAQLELFVNLVNTEQVDSALAMETFETTERGNICLQFSSIVEIYSDGINQGPLSKMALDTAIETARRELEPKIQAKVDKFHLSDSWRRELNACLERSEDRLYRENTNKALALYKSQVSRISEQEGCYFLDRAARLHDEFQESFDFDSATTKREARDHAKQLQRTALVECVKLGSFLLPLVPWCIWPIYFLSGGTNNSSGFLYAGFLFGMMYAVFKAIGSLPSFLDVDYPVLRRFPFLLDVLVWFPPSIPWFYLTRLLGFVGACWSTSKLISARRAPGEGHFAAELCLMRTKLDELDRQMKTLMVLPIFQSAAMDVSKFLEQGDFCAAHRTLLECLRNVCKLEKELLCEIGIYTPVYKLARSSIKNFGRIPIKSRSAVSRRLSSSSGGSSYVVDHNLQVDLASGNLEAALMTMTGMLKYIHDKLSSDEPAPKLVDEKSAPLY